MSRRAETKVFEIPELRLYILQFLPPAPPPTPADACCLAKRARRCALACVLSCVPFKRPLVSAAVLR